MLIVLCKGEGSTTRSIRPVVPHKWNTNSQKPHPMQPALRKSAAVPADLANGLLDDNLQYPICLYRVTILFIIIYFKYQRHHQYAHAKTEVALCSISRYIQCLGLHFA